MLNRLLSAALPAALAVMLIGGLFTSTTREIKRDLSALTQAVTTRDFAGARKYLSEQARQHWWLDGLEQALANRATQSEYHRRTITGMFEIYSKMLLSAQVVRVETAGEEATVTIRMETVMGGFIFPLDFPTIWRRDQTHWRLVHTPWNSKDLINAHTAAHRAAGQPTENHPGYPPFPLENQNGFRLEKTPKPKRARYRCPRDMVPVPGGPAVFRYNGQRYLFSGETDHAVTVASFCIDRYEASRPEATAQSPDGGHHKTATSRRGVIPWSVVRWTQAQAACERAGKRLCTGPEWQKAAGGPAGLLYPNGWEFDDTVCNTFDSVDGARHIAATGRFPKCKSPYGAYDMTGNLSEWTDELWQKGTEERVLRGGSFNMNPINDQVLLPFFGWRFIGYGESVAALHHHPPDDAHHDDGFRCCLTPQ